MKFLPAEAGFNLLSKKITVQLNIKAQNIMIFIASKNQLYNIVDVCLA